MKDSSLEPKQKSEDKALDFTLRPKTWEEYVGQQKIKENLAVIIEAAQKRNEAIEHILLYGPAGLGKTTLANIIAREMNANLKITSGPAIEKAGDLASLLTNLEPGDVLFIDEAHRLNKMIEEILYPAMESRVLDIIVGKGVSAKTIQLNLPPFTLIAATTRINLLSSPLRSRFGATFRLDFYTHDDIVKILERSARVLELAAHPQALEKIAQSSRFTPRVANRLLKRARDFAQVKGEGVVTEAFAKEALIMLDVDHLGLETADKRVLEAIIHKFEGGPVGLQSLAAATSEEEDTILDIYEPYLLRLGFIERTPRGRVATKKAYEHFDLQYPEHLNLKNKI
ncbi:MAG: Holliday junction branch migration DNA helicase RuvB [Patescibacteria group bacterium]